MSRDRDTESAILIGGIILIGMLGKRTSGVAWGAGWHWPVPTLITRDGKRYPATISSGVRHVSRPDHHGIDVMFKRDGVADRLEYKPGSSDGSTSYFAPPGTPIFAARDGRVWSVEKGPRGWEVVIDHGKPWATFYTHLDRVDIEPHKGGKPLKGGAPTIVKAGDMLGTMGFDPLDPAKLRHLHFEAWYEGHGNSATQDPAGVIGSWGRTEWRI